MTVIQAVFFSLFPRQIPHMYFLEAFQPYPCIWHRNERNYSTSSFIPLYVAAMAFISTSYILYYKVLLNIYFVSSPFREVCAVLGAPLKVSFIVQYSSYCIISYCLLRFTFCSLDLFIFHPFGETIYCFIGSTYCIRFITSCYCLYL